MIFASLLIFFLSCRFIAIFLSSEQKDQQTKDKKKQGLTCGKTANYTQYDHLRGITNRSEHPHIPEPEVAIMFRKKGSKNSDVDMNELETRLKKLKKQVCLLY